jgi:hypothetical protein
MKTPVSAVIVIAFGLVILAGYFIEIPLLVTLREIFLQWAVLLWGVALLVGIANLFSVHWHKATSGEKGSIFSGITVFALMITVAVAAYFGPTGSWTLWIYNYIQVPIEASLMAILAVVLIYAAARLLRRRVSAFSLVFVLTGLVMLAGSAPLFGIEIPGLHGPGGLRALIAQIPAVAGARGILLGVSLGVIATGLRVLMGVDRPYGG